MRKLIRVANPVLIETIKMSGGKLHFMDYHNSRFNSTRLNLFKIKDPIDLVDEIQISEEQSRGIFKCRITYGEHINKIEFEPYIQKKISSLKLVVDNRIDYSFKYANRTHINELFLQKGECEDILIIKNGYVTDSSFANVVFWDGNQWITPSTPLLKGTARDRLIHEKRILEREIKVGDLHNFTKARLVNAMVSIEDSADIFIDKII